MHMMCSLLFLSHRYHCPRICTFTSLLNCCSRRLCIFTIIDLTIPPRCMVSLSPVFSLVNNDVPVFLSTCIYIFLIDRGSKTPNIKDHGVQVIQNSPSDWSLSCLILRGWGRRETGICLWGI